MKVFFITDDFEFAHGKKPKGYGGWAFGLTRRPAVQSDDIIWAPSGTFAEAKKFAAAEARRRAAEMGAESDYQIDLWVLS